jgi:hypothetical protein
VSGRAERQIGVAEELVVCGGAVASGEDRWEVSAHLAVDHDCAFDPERRPSARVASLARLGGVAEVAHTLHITKGALADRRRDFNFLAGPEPPAGAPVANSFQVRGGSFTGLEPCLLAGFLVSLPTQ